MRIVFFGSPAFALPSLEALLASHQEVVAVVTQPDRPAGRGHAFTPPPVKVLALEHGLPVLQPPEVSDPESFEALQAVEADVFVVAAYGQILRRRVLDLPRRGCLNVHASLLPRHRGASPIAAAILAGDAVTGVTIMEMVRALDAGPMVASVEVAILDTDTTGTLEGRLAEAGARRLLEVLDAWAAGEIVAVPQDESLATYTPQLSRADAALDWSRPAIDLWRAVRAYQPWPVAHTTFGGEELRILGAWPLPEAGSAGSDAPGAVLGLVSLPGEAGAPAGRAMAVQAGEGILAVLRLQRQGGRPMPAADFLRGRPELAGARLGA